MKVLALTRYGRDGASSRVRFLQYLPALSRAGVDVVVHPLWGPDYLPRLYRGGRRSAVQTLLSYARRGVELVLELARGADVVWIEAELFPYLPGVVEGALPTPFVVDYDDAVYEKYRANRVLRGKIDRIMRAARCVVAANDAIADHARAIGARAVEVLPTVVDPGRYPEVEPPPSPPLRLGWIGTPHTARYLEAIAPALARAAARVDLEVRVIGAQALLPGVASVSRTWSEQTEAEELAACHVGIMPLPDGPWERGKSGYKLIQAMACARPVIASPVGVNQKIVDAGVGWLAADADAWVTAIEQAGADAGRRQTMGRAARARVEEHYSLAVTAPRLVDVLTRASR